MLIYLGNSESGTLASRGKTSIKLGREKSLVRENTPDSYLEMLIQSQVLLSDVSTSERQNFKLPETLPTNWHTSFERRYSFEASDEDK